MPSPLDRMYSSIKQQSGIDVKKTDEKNKAKSPIESSSSRSSSSRSSGGRKTTTKSSNIISDIFKEVSTPDYVKKIAREKAKEDTEEPSSSQPSSSTTPSTDTSPLPDEKPSQLTDQQWRLLQSSDTPSIYDSDQKDTDEPTTPPYQQVSPSATQTGIHDRLPNPIESSLMGSESQFLQAVGQSLHQKRMGSETQQATTTALSDYIDQETISEEIPSGRPITIIYERPDGTTNTITESSSNLNDKIEQYNELDYRITNITDNALNKTYYDTPSTDQIQQQYQSTFQEEYKQRQPIERPSEVPQEIFNTLENQYRQGKISEQEFQELSIYYQALNTKPDYYRFVDDATYANTITDLSLNKISEEEAQEQLQELIHEGAMDAPQQEANEWATEYADLSEEPGTQNVQAMQSEEPALQSMRYDKDAPEGERIKPVYDYIKGAREIDERTASESDFPLISRVSKGVLDVATTFPAAGYSLAGTGFRVHTGQAGTPQEERQKLEQDVGQFWYGMSKAGRSFGRAVRDEEGGDYLAPFIQTAMSPTITDILIPAGIGGVIKGAAPLVRGFVKGSTRLSGLATSATRAGSKIASKAPTLTKTFAKGAKYVATAGLTLPIWKPTVQTAYQEYQGQAEPGSTISRLGRTAIQLASFGLGSRAATKTLNLPSKQYKPWQEVTKGESLERMAQKYAQAGSKFKSLARQRIPGLDHLSKELSYYKDLSRMRGMADPYYQPSKLSQLGSSIKGKINRFTSLNRIPDSVNLQGQPTYPLTQASAFGNRPYGTTNIFPESYISKRWIPESQYGRFLQQRYGSGLVKKRFSYGEKPKTTLLYKGKVRVNTKTGNIKPGSIDNIQMEFIEGKGIPEGTFRFILPKKQGISIEGTGRVKNYKQLLKAQAEGKTVNPEISQFTYVTQRRYPNIPRYQKQTSMSFLPRSTVKQSYRVNPLYKITRKNVFFSESTAKPHVEISGTKKFADVSTMYGKKSALTGETKGWGDFSGTTEGTILGKKGPSQFIMRDESPIRSVFGRYSYNYPTGSSNVNFQTKGWITKYVPKHKVSAYDIGKKDFIKYETSLSRNLRLEEQLKGAKLFFTKGVSTLLPKQTAKKIMQPDVYSSFLGRGNTPSKEGMQSIIKLVKGKVEPVVTSMAQKVPITKTSSYSGGGGTGTSGGLIGRHSEPIPASWKGIYDVPYAVSSTKHLPSSIISSIHKLPTYSLTRPLSGQSLRRINVFSFIPKTMTSQAQSNITRKASGLSQIPSLSQSQITGQLNQQDVQPIQSNIFRQDQDEMWRQIQVEDSDLQQDQQQKLQQITDTTTADTTTQTPDTTPITDTQISTPTILLPMISPYQYRYNPKVQQPAPKPREPQPTPFKLPEDEEEPEPEKPKKTLSPFSIYGQKSKYYETPKIWKAPAMTRRRFAKKQKPKFFKLV